MKKILLIISVIAVMFILAGCGEFSDMPVDEDKELSKGSANLAGQAFTSECEKTCPYANWLGDNWCDDGSPDSYDPKVNCYTEACGWDEGDCKEDTQSGPYCTDSDGDDIMQKGVVESHYASGDVAASYPDSCVDANTVEEVTCYGTQPVATNHKCENGCKDGKCLTGIPPICVGMKDANGNVINGAPQLITNFPTWGSSLPALSKGSIFTIGTKDAYHLLQFTSKKDGKIIFKNLGDGTNFEYALDSNNEATIKFSGNQYMVKWLPAIGGGGPVERVQIDVNGDGSLDSQPACLFSIPTSSVGNLSKYPGQFVKDGKYDGFMVVGSEAPAIDNLAIVDIAMNMKLNGQAVQIINAAKLDSEILDIVAQNLIVVGSPCVNTVAAQVEGYSTDCKNGLTAGKSKIKLMKWSNGKHLLLVTGFSGDDRRVAAKVLAHRFSDLSGSEVEISGNDYLTATITKIN
jgi:hypothetical protein